ncbi:unnamed protein product [Adineta steineri]|uniref:Uncharacterized protein n=1 Tax=Adineta steineri TaxID=433720 RepID=A0A818R625_9BILA|nr:unnamed protein product [Adineta steineri]CAF3648827.1 unnamed protein product [Adineta steineri]
MNETQICNQIFQGLNYTRDQLNKNSTLLNRSLNDDRLYKIEQERSDLQRNLVHTSTHFDQLASEKHGLTVALDDLRAKFGIEKQNLVDELDMLRVARSTFEQEQRTRDQELQKIRDRSRISSEELKNAQTKVHLLEQQLEQQLNKNKDLNDEVHQIRLESTNLQRNLNDHHLASRERDRLQGIVAELETETDNLRQELKSHDNRYTEAQFLRNKLADEKSALMKEVSRLENLTKGFERELDQLRYTVRDRTDTLQAKDKELAALRKKEQSFISSIETIQSKLDSELTKNKDLDAHLRQAQRQLNIEIQNALSAKRSLTEYEIRNTHLQDEASVLLREKDQLTNLISTLKQRLTSEEDLTSSLRTEIQELEDRVKEIDRLKSLEDLIQSQRWDDISQMALTMQSVSRTMARATSPTTIRKHIELQ